MPLFHSMVSSKNTWTVVDNEIRWFLIGFWEIYCEGILYQNKSWLFRQLWVCETIWFVNLVRSFKSERKVFFPSIFITLGSYKEGGFSILTFVCTHNVEIVLGGKRYGSLDGEIRIDSCIYVVWLCRRHCCNLHSFSLFEERLSGLFSSFLCVVRLYRWCIVTCYSRLKLSLNHFLC